MSKPKAENMFFANSVKEGKTKKDHDMTKLYLDKDNAQQILTQLTKVLESTDTGAVLTFCVARTGDYPSSYGFVDAKKPRPGAQVTDAAAQGRAAAAEFNQNKRLT